MADHTQKILAEKYQQVVTENGKTLDKQQVMNSVENMLSEGSFVGLEVVSHNGNKIMPVVEIWEQDGILKISVITLDQTLVPST